MVGLAVGIGLIILFTIQAASMKLDASKFTRVGDHPFLTDDVVAKSVQAASRHELTADFLDKFGSDSRPEYRIAYLDVDQVMSTKYSSEGTLREELAFLPDSEPAILVMFRVDRTPIEEHPLLRIYIDQETYEICGAFKRFW